MTTPKAIIKPDLLTWARETAGFSLSDAARRLQKPVEQLESWERGADRPTLAQLRQVANAYKRPISDFYLPKRPDDVPLPHDFRRLPGEVANVYSPSLRHQMRLAQTRRLIFEEIGDELKTEIARFGLHLHREADPETLGREIRQFLGVTFTEQQTWRDARRAYGVWRGRIEATGVLIFQITGVSPSEMLGFAFASDPLPVIGINRKVKHAGRTFTLLHELVHVGLGENSLCDMDEDAPRPLQEQRTEVFCNAVAAAALVPRSELLGLVIVENRGPGRHEWSDHELDAIARTFAVSEESVLRRLLTVGRTSREFYVVKRAQYLARYARLDEQEREAAADQEIRRNMPQETLSNLGPRYTRLVLESFNQDNITLIDASRYLGLKAKHIRKLEDLALGS